MWMIEPQSENVIEDVKNILRDVAKKLNSKFNGKTIQRHSEIIPESNSELYKKIR